ncbi:dienelactone hydrolase family protein [Comamonadaceae bacterium M7527]|nr:dienelactone hydrolase family protein [Comamonadaceae bacterium M7527]
MSESVSPVHNSIQDAQALLDKAVPSTPPTRRTALKAALGVGYAAAVLPELAHSAIYTPGDDLVQGEVMVDVDGFKMPVYRSQPKGDGPFPVVLVLSEIFGVHEHIADITRRFAKLGYMALAPELFVRHGDAQGYAVMADLFKEVINKVRDEQVMTDLDALVDWAGQNGGDTNRLGVTGFCWGGRQVWLYAAHQPKVKAGVAWYGRLVGNVSERTPKQPVDVAASLKAPVLGLYGGADTGIGLDTVALMQNKLKGAGNNKAAQASRFVVFDNAPHAFHADYRPSYRAEAAKDGWAQCLQWMAANGVK